MRLGWNDECSEAISVTKHAKWRFRISKHERILTS